jgi:hypothetical protein
MTFFLSQLPVFKKSQLLPTPVKANLGQCVVVHCGSLLCMDGCWLLTSVEDPFISISVFWLIKGQANPNSLWWWVIRNYVMPNLPEQHILLPILREITCVVWI